MPHSFGSTPTWPGQGRGGHSGSRVSNKHSAAYLGSLPCSPPEHFTHAVITPLSLRGQGPGAMHSFMLLRIHVTARPLLTMRKSPRVLSVFTSRRRIPGLETGKSVPFPCDVGIYRHGTSETGTVPAMTSISNNQALGRR